jgi:hypothetical protein
VRCSPGLFSSHGICVGCGKGKEPNQHQSECINCLNGTYSDSGECKPCPAGTESHSLVGAGDGVSWADWAETDPHSLEGAADCIVCHGGRYKEEGWTACEECDGGYEPTTNHTQCIECPAGRAGINGTCDLCPDGFRPNALPQSCTIGNKIENSDVDCVGMTGDVCEFQCNFGFTAQGTHRCGLQAFEGGFCAPNDCIDGFRISNSPTLCSGYLNDKCVYTCAQGYTASGPHVCGPSRAFTGGFCHPNECENGTTITHSSTTCTSRTGENCAYVCDRGYFAAGLHTCSADGVLRGGKCLPSTCTAGTMLQHSSTECIGTTGDNCLYSCDPGYAPSAPHVCSPDGSFRGGECVPRRCTGGVVILHSPTVCNGTTADICPFNCDRGYSAQGTHTCMLDGSFTGGSCTPKTCTAGLTIAHAIDNFASIEYGSTTCAGMVGSRCAFVCDAGYTAVGTHVCDINGTFTGGSCVVSPSHPLCGPGKWSNGTSNCSSWSECIVGVTVETVPPTASSDRNCSNVTICDPGRFVLAAPTLVTDTICAECSTGSFQPLQQQYSCTPCAVGRFDHDLNPETECAICPAGTFQLSRGQVECTLCPWETFDHDLDSSTACIPCMEGFNSTEGRTACRPNPCTRGLTIQHSAVQCRGAALDECYFTCANGYTAIGHHMCESSGAFVGGWCSANACTRNTSIYRSPTTCTERTNAQCPVHCDEGYSVAGSHVCAADGLFGGGECLPNPCTRGLTIENSNVTCVGVTGDECYFNCSVGYTVTASHVCDKDGEFKGGSCTKNPPERTFCVQCREGTMGKHGLCFQCQDGWQDVEPDQTECEPCPPGYAGAKGFCFRCANREAPDANRTNCNSCASNFASGPAGMCWRCTSGQMPNTTTADSVGCLDCPAGRAGVDGFCLQCSPGFQPNFMSTTCEECTRGQYSSDGTMCATCAPGERPNFGRSACENCPAGYSGWQGRCSACVSGYQPHGNKTICEECPVGFAGRDGVCGSCASGQEPSKSRTECALCAPGRFKHTSSADIASTAAGSSSLVSHEQINFPKSHINDGNRTSFFGWAFDGGASKSSPRSVVIAFRHDRKYTVDRLTITSGNALPTYHVTGVVLYSTIDSIPSLNGNWSVIYQPIVQDLATGLTRDNAVFDNCYMAKPITVRIYTKQFASDIKWQIDDGPMYGNGQYADNALIEEEIFVSAGQHEFKYYDISSFTDGWNGGYFHIFAYDGTFLAGGINAVRLGVLVPGSNPVSSGLVQFAVSESLVLLQPNCSGLMDVSFHPVSATAIRVDVVDSDLSTKNAVVNEISIYANSLCYTCSDGQQPEPSHTACMPCPVDAAGTGGTCTQCPNGQEPNFMRTSCIPCRNRTAGLLGVCVECAPGTGPNPAKTDCIRCTAGKFSTTGHVCQTCHTGFGALLDHTDCKPCEPGNVGQDGICTRCDSGSQPNPTRSSCLHCPPAWAGTDGICTACLVGFEQNLNRTECIQCAPGRIRNVALDACATCLNGTQPNKARTECLFCSAGRAGMSGACDQCPSGRHPNREAILPLRLDGTLAPAVVKQWNDACAGSWLYPPAGFEITKPRTAFAHGLPMHWADWLNSTELASLPNQGREIGPSTVLAGRTSLMQAAMYGHASIVRLLLQHENVNIDTAEPFTGLTAFHFACLNGHADTVDVLVHAGCNMALKAHNGWTGRDAAQFHDHSVVLQRLSAPAPLQPGGVTVNINFTSPCMQSALWLAVDYVRRCIPAWQLQNRSDSSECVSCAPASAGVGGRCVRCAPGSMPNGQRTECTQCSLGQFSVSGEQCALCPIGHTSDNLQSGCVPCPLGSVSQKGVCTKCGSGKQPDATVSSCEACPVGRAGIEGTCQECAAGTRVDYRRTMCNECSAGKFKTSNRNMSLDMPRGPILAAGWILIAATSWHVSDRVKIWVEDADRSVSAVLLDTSLAASDSVLVEDSWNHVSAHITGSRSAIIKFSVTMIDDHSELGRHLRSKIVLFDAFSIANEVSSGIVAFSSFEESAAKVTVPYVDACFDAPCLVQHVLVNHVGENLVARLAPSRVLSWRGFSPVWSGEELGFTSTSHAAQGLLGSCSDGGRYGTKEVCEGPPGSPTGHSFIRGNVGIVHEAKSTTNVTQATRAVHSTADSAFVADADAAMLQAPYTAVHGNQFFLLQDIAGRVEVELTPVHFLHTYTPSIPAEESTCSDGTTSGTRESCVGPRNSPTYNTYTPVVPAVPSVCTDGTVGGTREYCEKDAIMPTLLECKLCADGHGPTQDKSRCEPCPRHSVSTIGRCERCASGKQPNGVSSDACAELLPCGAWYEQCTGICVPRRGPFDQRPVDAHTQCVACPAGRAGVEGTCLKCAAGSEPNHAKTECQPCTRGKVSTQGKVCAFCPDGHRADKTNSVCVRCPRGFIGVGGICSVCPSGDKPNQGQFHGRAVSWQSLEAGFCVANDNRFELVQSPTVLDWTDAQIQATSLGGHLATIQSAAEQLCAAAVIQNAVAWIGASSDASGEWSWITGETWSYEVWATPASSVAPWWAAATSANALVGWAGHNAMANRSVNGHWYPCGSGCPRPRSVLVEYESTDTYTCVSCPWGYAGVDGVCDECLAGFEVGPGSTSCTPCAAGYINPDGASANVAGQLRGGSALVSGNLGASRLCNTTGCNTIIDGISNTSYAGWSTAGAQSAVVIFAGTFPVSNVTIVNRYHFTKAAVYITADTAPSLTGDWAPVGELGLWDKAKGIVDGNLITTDGHDSISLYFNVRMSTGLRLDVLEVKGLAATINEISVAANVQCEICPNGTQVNPARTKCEACPANYAGLLGICAACPSGQLPNSGQTVCIDCPLGNAGTDGFCSVCPPGTEPNVAKTECITCSSGHYSFFGRQCYICPTGFEAVTRPLCDALPCPTDPWNKGFMTKFDFDVDIDAFRTRSSGGQWAYAPKAPRSAVNGLMQRTDDSSTGSIYTNCLLSQRTIRLELDCLPIQQQKGSTFKISVAGTVYAFVDLPGSDSFRTEAIVHALNGASSNMQTFPMHLPDSSRPSWTRSWIISIELGSWVPLDLGVELGFTHDGGAPAGISWPIGAASSDILLDNVVVVGGVCGTGLGRCVCLPGDNIASVGVYSGASLPPPDVRIGCKACPAGHIGVSGVCYECASGKRPNEQRNQCVDCLPGTAGIDGFCRDCGPGQETAQGQTLCVSCPSGKYKPSGLVSCFDCWEGAVANEASTWCECPPGMSTITEIPLGCDARGDDAFFATLDADFPVVVRCNIGCRLQPYDVWGSGPYMEHSSICAAATHATGENGGRFELRLDPPRNHWSASKRAHVQAREVTQAEAAILRSSDAAWRRNGAPVRGFNLTIPERFEQSCIDKDECATNNGGCDVLTKCSNVAPGRICGNCPDGYYGPLPSAGWALSGNTTCMPVPKAGNKEMLLPQVSLEIQGPAAALEVDSVERRDFVARFVSDIAEALDVQHSNVLVTDIARADKNRRRLQSLSSVSLTVQFTVKVTDPAQTFAKLNQQLLDRSSPLLNGNVTSAVTAGQAVEATDIKMVCPPRSIEAQAGSGTCQPCPAGTEFQLSITNLSASRVGVPGLEVCIPCPRAKFSTEGGTCGHCPPGTQPNNESQGASACIRCSDIVPPKYSANGTFCSACIDSQVPSSDSTRCICDVGRLNMSALKEAAVCYDVHGIELGRSLHTGRECELCPQDAVGSAIPCIDCLQANASGVPMPGHWRSGTRSAHILRCEFGEDACTGGMQTLCISPYAGVACASCVEGHYRSEDGCLECEDAASTKRVLGASLAAVLFMVALAMRLERRCAAEPVMVDALSSAYPKSDIAVVCVRSLISFFQTQAILGRLRAPLPLSLSTILDVQAAFVDPAGAFARAICWVKFSGFDRVFTPPLSAAVVAALVLVVPAAFFVLGAIALAIRRWCHPKPIMAKAASIHKKFDSDKDGFLSQKDMGILAQRTRTEQYDDENWADWCAVLKAKPEKGLSVDAFQNLYLLKGPDGADELEKMFAALFATPKHVGKTEAADKFAAAISVLRDFCVSSAVVSFYILHPTSTAWLLTMFSCETLLDGMAVLRADRGVQCYTGSWMGAAMGYGLPALYLICHVVPAGTALVLRDAVQRGKLHDTVGRLGFLYRGYRPEKALWELVVSGRKIALAWMVVFLDGYGPSVQAVASVAVLQVALVLHVVHHPHGAALPHSLEVVTIAVSCTSAIAAAYHSQQQATETAADCAASPLGDSTCGADATTRPEAMGVAFLLCTLNVLLCAAAMVVIWHGPTAAVRRRYCDRSGEGGGPRSLVAKQRLLRAAEKGETTATAEQLRRKLLSVSAATKTCKAVAQRLVEMQAEMPELSAEIREADKAVARLEALMAASSERTKAVQRQWSRGTLLARPPACSACLFYLPAFALSACGARV